MTDPILRKLFADVRELGADAWRWIIGGFTVSADVAQPGDRRSPSNGAPAEPAQSPLFWHFLD